MAVSDTLVASSPPIDHRPSAKDLEYSCAWPEHASDDAKSLDLCMGIVKDKVKYTSRLNTLEERTSLCAISQVCCVLFKCDVSGGGWTSHDCDVTTSVTTW
jgi:hypothetical protein